MRLIIRKRWVIDSSGAWDGVAVKFASFIVNYLSTFTGQHKKTLQIYHVNKKAFQSKAVLAFHPYPIMLLMKRMGKV